MAIELRANSNESVKIAPASPEPFLPGDFVTALFVGVSPCPQMAAGRAERVDARRDQILQSGSRVIEAGAAFGVNPEISIREMSHAVGAASTTCRAGPMAPRISDARHQPRSTKARWPL